MVGWDRARPVSRLARSLGRKLISPLLLSEAIEVPVAAGRHEVRIAAALAAMRGVPRRITAAGAVEVAELRAAGRVARPVVARLVLARGERPACGRRTGQNVVLIQRLAVGSHIARTEYRGLFFGERSRLRQVVAELSSVDRIAVQVRHVAGDDLTA